MTHATTPRWLHGFANLLAVATFFLIIAGALVTSNDAGLSVPDWPTSFGTFRMPRMVGGVLYEHGHRMIAGTVGLLTVALALCLGFKEPRRWVRKLGGFAVLAVVAQAALGGMTVLFYLPVPISVGHAALGQIFFCITVALALFTRPDWNWDEARTRDTSTPSLRQLTTVTTSAILLQLILGAAFRHAGLGIAPHVAGAAVVTFLIAWLVTRSLMHYSIERRLARPALVLGGLLLVQLFLGIGSYFLKMANLNAPQPMPRVVVMTTTHVAVGALVLAASLVLTLQTYRWIAAPGHGVTDLQQRASVPKRVTP